MNPENPLFEAIIFLMIVGATAFVFWKIFIYQPPNISHISSPTQTLDEEYGH